MKKQFMLIGLLAIATPIIVNILVFIPTPVTFGDGSSWLSFFGSYFGGIFGAIIGGLVAYYVAKMQVGRLERKEKLKEHLRQYPLLLEIQSEINKIERELKKFQKEIDYYEQMDLKTGIFNETYITIDLEMVNNEVWNNVKNIEYLELMKILFKIKTSYEQILQVFSLKTPTLLSQRIEISNKIFNLKRQEIDPEIQLELNRLLKNEEKFIKKIRMDETIKKELYENYIEIDLLGMVQSVQLMIREKIEQIENNKLI